MPLTEKDRLLINQLLSGTPGAWNVFVDRFSGLIVQVIRHAAHNHSLKLSQDDIDDLTADVFTSLLDRNMGSIRGFRGRSSFATYLSVVVRRVVSRKLSQRRYLQAFGHVAAHQASLVEAGDSDSRDIEVRDEVDSLMSRLPDSVRAVVEMFYLRGRSYREISRHLRVPMNTIGPTLARAKFFLRGSHKAS
jgi:RNA polymerase sigma-70 factor (ECF subfamily)